jgi:hypothetical protein
MSPLASGCSDVSIVAAATAAAASCDVVGAAVRSTRYGR